MSAMSSGYSSIRPPRVSGLLSPQLMEGVTIYRLDSLTRGLVIELSPKAEREISGPLLALVSGRLPRTSTPTSGESGTVSRTGSESSFRALRSTSRTIHRGRRIRSAQRAASISSWTALGAAMRDGRRSADVTLPGVFRVPISLRPGFKRPSLSTPSSAEEPTTGTERAAATERDLGLIDADAGFADMGRDS